MFKILPQKFNPFALVARGREQKERLVFGEPEFLTERLAIQLVFQDLKRLRRIDHLHFLRIYAVIRLQLPIHRPGVRHNELGVRVHVAFEIDDPLVIKPGRLLHRLQVSKISGYVGVNGLVD